MSAPEADPRPSPAGGDPARPSGRAPGSGSGRAGAAGSGRAPGSGSGRAGAAGSGRAGSPDSCAPFRELASAALDGELVAAERQALEVHLGGCVGCRAHAARLRRLLGTLGGLDLAGVTPGGAPRPFSLGPGLAPDALARLEARLVAAAAPPVEAPVEAPLEGGAAEWSLLRRPGLALAAASLLAAAGLVGVAVLRQPPPGAGPGGPPLATGPEAPPAPLQEQPPPPPPAPPPPEAPPVETPPPAEPPPPAETPPDSELPPAEAPPPEAPPVPLPPPSEPTPPPEAPPPDLGPTRERPGEGPAGPVVAEVPVDRDGLRRHLAAIRAAEPRERPGLVLELGTPRFDHEDAYAFLAAVLKGELDGLPAGRDAEGRAIGPNEVREAAWLALGRFGGERAARVLLGAPLREGALGDRDRAALLAALSGLKSDEAVALVGEAALRGPGEEERLLCLRALGALARPSAIPALAAVFREARQPAALRREAGVALGGCRHRAVLEPLLQGLEERRPAVRQGAALGLGRLARGLPELAGACLGGLVRALGDKDTGVAEAGARGLAASRLGAAIPVLIDRLDPLSEPRRTVRGLCAEGLLLLTGQTFVDPSEARAWWVRGWLRPIPRGLQAPAEGANAVALVADAARPFRLPDQGEGLVFLLDVSGSMNVAKWDLVRRELGKGLISLAARRPRDQVGLELIPFADAPRPLFRGLAPSSADTVNRAIVALERQRPVPAAQTDIGKAIRLAMSYQGVDTIYLVTDGADSTQDLAALLYQIGRDNRRRERPLRIHTVLVRDGGPELVLDDGPGAASDPWDIVFMRRLARENGGRFVRSAPR